MSPITIIPWIRSNSNFSRSLLDWRSKLTDVSEEIIQDLKKGDLRQADPVDYGSLQAQKQRGILAKSRNNQLIEQIEHALFRINQGEFGYCEMTREEIGQAAHFQ